MTDLAARVTETPEHAVLGAPLDRVDGPRKVRGAAPYATDVTYPDLAHAALVQSTIAAGRIRRIDVTRALASPGVIAIVTHENVPPLAEPPTQPFFPGARFPLEDDRVLHRGQHVAVVVAESREQAVAAARLVVVDYEVEAAALDLDDPAATRNANPLQLDVSRGDVAAALAAADVVLDCTYDIAAETNNPMGLFGTVACWRGDALEVHDATQWTMNVRDTLAAMFGLPKEEVRVCAPYVGGGFGAGLRVWPHTMLAAVAARMVGRPVKLVLGRPQMFDSIGHRPQTRQRVRLGATRDGRLVALDLEGVGTSAVEDRNVEPLTLAARTAYACPNLAARETQVLLNIPSPNAMRGPGAVEGNFALESALDELSYRIDLDPIELRLRNYAEVHPQSGLPWSSKALRECYRAGAERFGWSTRDRRVGATRRGHVLVGTGMAGVTYEWYSQPCKAGITVTSDGRVRVRSSGTDIGTGTYTIAAQLTAHLLGVDVSRVEVQLGDTDSPRAPQSGGSGLAIALAGAIESAVANLRQELAALGVTGEGGDVAEALDGLGLAGLSADGEVAPHAEGAGMAPAPAFAAHFVEVHVDADLGVLRVARVVSAVDGGRILNAKLAASQIKGGVVMGIGMALLEATLFDGTGRVANATFGDYLIPVNADVPDIDVLFVGEPDRFNAVGIKGVGEIGIVGVAAAIANAVYHATGRRLRSLPITLDQLL